MKVLYALTALLVTFGAPFAFKADAADESYSFFVSMPDGAGSSYGEYLASSKANTTSSEMVAFTDVLATGKLAGKTKGSALELRFFSRLATLGAGLKSTKTGFTLIVR